jgi:putative flippase GtrA
MSLHVLITRYAFFAVIATVVNLAVQRTVFVFKSEASGGFYPAILAGTGAGLAVKYLLDKRWIFNDLATGVRSHARRFSLYSLMGVFTTLIFWTFETGFWLLWRTDYMREIGAIIGLCIGYVVKFQLDRRFVFTDKKLHARTSP